MQLALSSQDRVFDYRIGTGGKWASCTKKAVGLSCDMVGLELKQAAQYEIQVDRTFNSKAAGTVLKRKLTTVDPVNVVNTSLAGGQTIYHAPGEMTVTFSKPIQSVDGVVLETVSGDKRSALATTTSIKGEVLTVKFAQPLPRMATLSLTVGGATSPNGSFLATPLVLPLTTSGGPKVQAINIGSFRIQPGEAISLTLDVPLAAGQDLASLVKVEAGGATVSAAVTGEGKRITIRPNALGRCTPFTVRVLDGLKNEHGVAGGSAWQFRSRIICQTQFSIGSSVEGRGITAYRFGEGASKIVFVGGTHGDERSSVQILQKWVEQLEVQGHRIPASQSITVIPNLNPDGYAASRRVNSNNVDLNRNFPSNNWKSGVTMPNKSFLEYGGGKSPLSEPESAALASYVIGLRPRLVLTYHASGSVVVPNDSGDSVAIARAYANRSSVNFLSNGNTGSFFEYDTTGAFEDWLHDKISIPALLIELKTQTSNDYSGHENALWYTMQL